MPGDSPAASESSRSSDLPEQGRKEKRRDRMTQHCGKVHFLGRDSDTSSRSSSSDDMEISDGDCPPFPKWTSDRDARAAAAAPLEKPTESSFKASVIVSSVLLKIEQVLFRERPPPTAQAPDSAAYVHEPLGEEKFADTAALQGDAPNNSSHDPYASTCVVVDDPQSSWLERFARHSTRRSRNKERRTHLSRSHLVNSTSYGEFHQTVYVPDAPEGYQGSAAITDVNLVEAILGYKDNPNDWFSNLIQAALANRSYPDNPVTFDELRAASGSPYLVQTLITSGSIDPRDKRVQQLIQQEMESTLSAFKAAAARGEGLDAFYCPYLRCLFQFPHVRVTRASAYLLENSGFEYVMLLHDFPHVMWNIPKRAWWAPSRPWENGNSAIWDACITIIGFALIMVDLSSLCAIGVYWGQSSATYRFGYWTLLMALGGYVASLIFVVILLARKLDSTLYEERIWEYPSANIKAIPLVPLLEGVLFVHLMRYCWAALKSRRGTLQFGDPVAMHDADRGGGPSYFIIRHDLYAFFNVVFTLHSQCHAFPQLLLQNYLFRWGGFNEGDPNIRAFKLFNVSASVSCCFSVVMFLRRILACRSVNQMGFAVFAADPDDIIDSVGKFFPKVLTFLLMFMLEYNIFFFVIAMIHINTCQTSVIVWVAIMGVIVAIVLSLILHALVSGKSSRSVGQLSILPLVAQIVFAIIAKMSPSSTEDGASCAYYSLTLGANVQVGIAAFSVIAAVWVAWIALSLWVKYGNPKFSSPTFGKLSLLFGARVQEVDEVHEPRVEEKQDEYIAG